MKVGKKLFPYPVLNNSKVVSSFKSSVYSLEFELEQNDKYFNLNNAHIVLENDDIERLVTDGRAKAVIILECSSTVYRVARKIGVNPENISFDISNLKDKVEISSYIYASEDIPCFSSNDFLEAYNGYEFYIDKYDIIAVDDGFTTKIIYDEDKDKKMTSIFSIVKSLEPELEDMQVSSEENNIVIVMPEKYFGYHDNMKYNDNFRNIFFAIIAIPALSKCLDEIKTEREKYNWNINEVIDDKTWFNSVVNRYKEVFGRELTFEDFIEHDSYELAQKLLGDASTHSLEDIYKLLFKTTGGDDDE